LPQLLFADRPVDRGGSRGRELPGLRIRPEIGLGVLVERPEDMVPPADALVLERLHSSDAGRHDPSSARRTHYLCPFFVVMSERSFGLEIWV